jgi:hypothetical protein
VPVFTIPPNWQRSVKLGENWEGIVKEALSTAEERLGTLPRPRYTLDYSTETMGAQETGYIRKILEGADDLPVAMPFWQDETKLTAPTVVGNVVCAVDFTAGTLFDVLPYAIIWHDFDSWETKRLFSISTTEITFADPIENVWAVGDFVVPVTLGLLRRPNAEAPKDTLGVFPVKFEEQFLQESSYLPFTIGGAGQYEQRGFAEEGIGGDLL